MDLTAIVVDLMPNLVNLALSLVGTVLGILVVYATFTPMVRFESRVRCVKTPQGEAQYNVVYWRSRFLALQDVRVRALLSVPPLSGSTHRNLIDVPVDDDAIPRISGRGKQLPLLLLERVDWSPLDQTRRPSASDDLRLTMSELQADLHVFVTATATIGGVSRSFYKVYRPHEIALPLN
ncbi:hypothetical protein ITJ57_18565 [Plantibacter sp. VKM Ac-2880]|uniref:hypothetical protein n=1 Tax=Plantibacter sp. VKM Ac-2880 TaxID=2783827 RepID=UPI00188EA0C0|nr:hypothetical protein [Plantibacter sp. VKM Ac-2880]MBF4570776.1 hypothetical protein [Plantibacter sp. VKM Ac-2880]